MKRLSLNLFVILLFTLPTISQAALGDYFVSTDWLAENKAQVVVIDVRRMPLYLLGHVEGALNVDRSRFLQTRNQVKSLVPTTAAMRELLSSLGVTPDSTLVVYAEDSNPYAARLVWTLRYHGHRKSFVLDGGYEKWRTEKRSISYLPSDDPQPSHYVFAADTDYLRARTNADYLYTRLENPSVVVWDTRSDEEYAGTKVRADRGGHIPGAEHLNWTELQKEVGGVKVLKSEGEIVALLKTHGLTEDKEIIAHCQTGIRSSYATLVLLGLGYKKASNYDGSWIEWANNQTLPIINAHGLLESSVPVSVSLGSIERDPVSEKTVTQ